MRIIHTADWHLGHTLREQSRTEEHAAFLKWLLDKLEAEAVDALLIAGDVFDSANPPTTALSMFYQFLASVRTRCPDLNVVVIGGNHDSAARLDAPRPLFDALGVHVVGGLPRTAEGTLDLDRVLVPLQRKNGRTGAWLVAIPFLRPVDLPKVHDTEVDPLIEGVRRVYAEAIQGVREVRKDGQGLLVAGHCFMAGGTPSEFSERKVLGGNQHALPIDLFPEDVDYVGLGHLHFSQRLDEAGRIRYAGSPIPLSMTEHAYQHQVVVIDLTDDGPVIDTWPIPREVELLRLPRTGPEPLDTVLDVLDDLAPFDPEEPEWRRPFLEVTVALDNVEPTLRAQVMDALKNKRPRLVSLRVERGEAGAALAEAVPRADLTSLLPEDVFRRRWERLYDGAPPDALLSAFHELLDAVESEDGT